MWKNKQMQRIGNQSRWTRGIGGAACVTLLGALAPQPAAAATEFVIGNIAASETWTADNEYILTQVIYVTDGATLTIEPGTVVRGEGESAPGALDPGALVIARGSKLMAQGTEQAPIIFTDLFDDNIGSNPGTAPYDQPLNALSLTGQWGGVILLGRGYVANNTLSGPNVAREVQIEGLTASGGLGLYGNGGNDDDDSGSLSYVSVRYGGFNLAANNEINGLTLGAVGRLTDVDHVEVFQNKDDGLEMFGGAVNLKHIVAANGGDDGIDYDEGWRGKAQFVFVMQGTPGADKSDKGAEQDGGNSPDGSQPFAIPTIYNATYVGLGGEKTYTDRLRNTALHFRDNAGGRYYNSFFADFGGAPLCIEGGNTGTTSTAVNSSGERSITDYVVDGAFYFVPDSAFQLELQDNDFWCFGNGGTVPAGDASAFGCDTGKIHHDNGALTNVVLRNRYFACGTSSPLRELTRTDSGDDTTPDPITVIDPRPASGSSLSQTIRRAPDDGFFSPVAYRGAFSPGSNWAAGWSNLARIETIPCTVSEVEPLTATTSSLSWTRPVGLDEEPVYDLLRSSSASDFGAATCVAANTASTTANDTATPAAGQVFFYLSAAENGCERGSLGFQSNGVQRIGIDCQ